MKKIMVVLVSLLLICSLVGCSKYSSHYSALLLISSQLSDSGYIRFSSFKGQKVFKFRSKEDSVLNCSLKLESGEAMVYYDYDGTKEELVAVRSGDDFDLTDVRITAGTTYVIVETNGKCENGDFQFKVEEL